jgi:ketosteroid isomerase-like protein
MNLAPVAIVLAVGMAQTVASRESADTAELTRLETVWNEAHVGGDAEVLDRLWAEDLEVAVPKMPVMTKAQALAFARSGRMKFHLYETSGVRIRIYGDAAVVTGRLRRERTLNGQVVDDDWRFTKVYVRSKGEWRVVAFHASEASQPSP